MKLFLTLAFLAAVASGQTPPRPELTADKLVHDGAIVRASGHAKAKLGDLTLVADEAALDSATGTLDQNLGQEPLAVHPVNQFRQQSLGTADRQARGDKHDPQRPAVGNRRQFSGASKHGISSWKIWHFFADWG